MKTIALFSMMLTIAYYTYAQTDGELLFDDSFLHEIRFEDTDTNIWVGSKNYQQVKMYVDGNLVNNTGFKRKGNISGYPLTNKYGIKIKANKYIQGQEYDGIKEFTLQMNYQDPTMLREKLSYDICRDLGLFSLRTAFAKVYINNIYWGLYTLVEGKDEMYKHVFDNRGMDAIESLDFGDMCFVSNNPDDYSIGDDMFGAPYLLENGDANTAWPLFTEMINKANNTPNDQYISTVSSYLNIEDFIKYQAFNVYLMNMDSYIAFRGNQIYVYDVALAKWQVTPWDFNASFGMWNTYNESPMGYQMIPNSISNGCIASKINEVPDLKTYYLDAMCHLNQIVGDTTVYFSKIDAWKNQIQQAVYDDTRKGSTNIDFDNGIAYGYHYLFGDNQPALKTFITDRLAVITAGLDAQNYTCASNIGIAEYQVNSLNVFPNPMRHSFTIKLEGATNIDYKVVNLTGQVIQSGKIENANTKINASEWETGVYILRINNNYTKLIKN